MEDTQALGQLLVARGVITSAQLEECVREQEERRGHGDLVQLGQILLRKRLINTLQLVSALREQKPEPEDHRIGRYEILQEAGRGGMAVVYRALDRNQARLVALKILKKEMSAHPGAVARFRREVESVSKLAHPNIVSVLDCGEEDGQPFLVMELVEGPTLADLYSRRTTERRALVELLRKVALAAHCAHEHGIVHRDLKPGNVLIDSAGEPRLTDFGLAHLSESETAITRPGAVIGTPLYMAPEQVEGRTGEIGARTDVYALGALLYEALTGRPPFIGETPTELYRRILDEDPPPLRKLQPDIPRDLEAVCLTALSKESSRRYASARELAEDLERFLRGEPVRARGVPLSRRLWKAMRRRPVAATLVAVLAVILVWRLLHHLDRQRTVRDLTTQARTAMARSRWTEARDLLVRALQIDPSTVEASDLREVCVREMERERESLVKALAAGARIEIILQDRESREANLPQLDRLIEEAGRELDEALLISPGLAVGWYQKGRLESLRWRFDEAQRALDRALALDPELAGARLERAQLGLLRLVVEQHPHLPESAVREWKRAVLERNREDFHILLTRERELPSQARRMAQVLEALLMFETSPGELAIESLQEAYRRYRDPQIIVWIGLLRHRLGDSAEARSVLENAIDERPYSILGRLALAWALQALGELEPALEQWDMALQVDPTCVPLLIGRAACLESGGKFEPALAALGQESRPEARMVRGRALLGLSRWDEAIREFTAILDAEPSAAWARVGRARAWAGRGQFDRAVQDLESASCDPEVRDKVAPLLQDYRPKK